MRECVHTGHQCWWSEGICHLQHTHPERLDGSHRFRELVLRLAQHVRLPAALDHVPVRLRGGGEGQTGFGGAVIVSSAEVRAG